MVREKMKRKPDGRLGGGGGGGGGNENRYGGSTGGTAAVGNGRGER